MIRSQFIEEIRAGFDNIVARAEQFGKLSNEQFNAKTSAHPWSIGQQFEHLLLSGVPIEKSIQSLVPSIPGADENDVNHTFIGRFLMKAAGPGGNAPVPSPFVPKDGRFEVESVSRFLAHCQAMKSFATQLEYKAIERVKIASPGGKLIKYSVADALMIEVLHATRHLNQMDNIARSAQFPAR